MKGFYVQNDTPNIVVLTTADGKITQQLQPDGDTASFPQEYEDDPNIQRALLYGHISLINARTGKAVQQEKVEESVKAEDRKTENVMSAIEDGRGQDLVQVQCCASTASGNRCTRHNYVPESELSHPHFCGQHIDSENPEDYELVGETWTKKVVA